jgi:hypothetical protein
MNISICRRKKKEAHRKKPEEIEKESKHDMYLEREIEI